MKFLFFAALALWGCQEATEPAASALPASVSPLPVALDLDVRSAAPLVGVGLISLTHSILPTN